MKKLVALLLVVLMLPCVVLAEDAAKDILSADPTEVMTFNREVRVTEWEGKWELVAAYVGEEFAEEYGVDTTGLIAVVPGAATLELTPILDGSANDKELGTMVDVASYIHAHVYDLAGSLTFSAEIADEDDTEPYTVKSAWDEWPNNVVRGEGDGDFNYGPAKTHVKGENDDTLYWDKITGVEIEDIDGMKYIGLNTAGQLILCYADDNVAKKDGEVGYAYIFQRVTVEE